MVSVLILPLFIVIAVASFVEPTDISNEICLLLDRKQVIKFLLENYENLNLNPYNVLLRTYSYVHVNDLRKHFQNFGRRYIGKDFLVEYVEKFGQFAKNQIPIKFAERAREMARKMVEELQNLEAKNSQKPKHVDFDEQAEKLMKIRRKLEKISERKINDTEDENQQGANYLISLKDEEQKEYFHEVLYGNIVNKESENWVFQNGEISKQQAKFFTMIQTTLCLLAQLRRIAENNTKKDIIVAQLEEIAKELNELKGEMVEKLTEIDGYIIPRSKTEEKQVKEEKLEIDVKGGEKTSENHVKCLKCPEKYAGQIHIEQGETSEGHKKDADDVCAETDEIFMYFIEKLKNELYFHAYEFIVRMHIEEMGETIDKIKKKIVQIKGVENIRKSFKLLKEMQTVLKDEEKTQNSINE